MVPLRRRSGNQEETTVQGAPAVELAGIGKRFRIRRYGPAGLKDHLLGWMGGRRVEYSDLWALSDISLQAWSGRTLGVVGANGSGKSTLLQIVAGIHAPDTGRVRVRGRLRALLELGAGFSQELSGRDNVFLNGALLGLARADIRSRFDAIVAFAEVDRFIDMPLKTYSSGMQLRLAFATAAHFDPEILLLDEVLAVGDDAFQRKCLTRVRAIRESGAAIVFVSHGLGTVERTSDHVIALDQGRIVDEGIPNDVVSRYRARQALGTLGTPGGERWGAGDVRLSRVVLTDAAGVAARQFETGRPMTVRFEYEARNPVARPVFGLAIRRDDGTLVTGPNTRMCGLDIARLEGAGTLEYRIPRLPLLPGVYLLAASVYDHDLVEAYDHWERCSEFVVGGSATGERFGVVSLEATWHLADPQAPAATAGGNHG